MALNRTNCLDIQGKVKKTRKFAAVKRLLNPKDIRLFVLCALPLSTGLMPMSQEGEPTKAEEEG